MKRIILALITLTAAGAMAFATTRAVWTDTVTITNNQVQTGTADLQVAPVNTSGVVGTYNTSTTASSLVLSGLIPNSSENGYSFALFNNSTAGLIFSLNTQATGATGVEGLDLSKLELSVYQDGASPDGGAGSSGWFSLSDWQSASRSLNSSINPGTGNTKKYKLGARLVSSADNNWQGKTVTLTLTVLGTQVI